MTANVYPFEVADGASQMALDDVMLDDAAEGIASLRFYAWNEPTASLGYFQPMAVRMILPRVPWLRRATGGALILHGDGDLTYSLALPAAKAWHAGEPWLCRMHHILQRALRHFDTATRTVQCGEERKFGDVLCFQDHTAGDVLHNDAKVVGSASRKHRGAVLQHGTMRIATSTLIPALTGLATAIEPDLLIAEALRQFHRETGWDLNKLDFTPEQRERQRNQRDARYANRDWNEKR